MYPPLRRLVSALIPLTVSALALTAAPALAETTTGQGFSVMTPASSVASRSDRRPNAGGLYDAVAFGPRFHRVTNAARGVHRRRRRRHGCRQIRRRRPRTPASDVLR